MTWQVAGNDAVWRGSLAWLSPCCLNAFCLKRLVRDLRDRTGTLYVSRQAQTGLALFRLLRQLPASDKLAFSQNKNALSEFHDSKDVQNPC